MTEKELKRLEKGQELLDKSIEMRKRVFEIGEALKTGIKFAKFMIKGNDKSEYYFPMEGETAIIITKELEKRYLELAKQLEKDFDKL
jgi:hypothetical protein